MKVNYTMKSNLKDNNTVIVGVLPDYARVFNGLTRLSGKRVVKIARNGPIPHEINKMAIKNMVLFWKRIDLCVKKMCEISIPRGFLHVFPLIFHSEYLIKKNTVMGTNCGCQKTVVSTGFFPYFSQ